MVVEKGIQIETVGAFFMESLWVSQMEFKITHVKFVQQFSVAVFAMSLVDSIAAFTVRCDEIDDSRQMAMLLNRQGINTFSSMAFSIGTPNQPPTDAAFEQFAQRVFTLPSMGQTGKLRRLLFEAQTFCARSAQDGSPQETKVSTARKTASSREAGTHCRFWNKGWMEWYWRVRRKPSYGLIDLCQTIYETGNIIWIHPSKCHKRDSEVRASVKDPKQIVKVESQMLKIDSEVVTHDAEHGTELKLMWCLQRRGFALDMTGVVSWEVHEKWVDSLFRAYASDVSQATRPVTLSQTHQSRLWTVDFAGPRISQCQTRCTRW